MSRPSQLGGTCDTKVSTTFDMIEMRFTEAVSKASWKALVDCRQDFALGGVKDGVYYCYCAYILRTPDTLISYRQCLLMQGYFCAVQIYAEKAELSKCSSYPKTKLGPTMHFSEIN